MSRQSSVSQELTAFRELSKLSKKFLKGAYTYYEGEGRGRGIERSSSWILLHYFTVGMGGGCRRNVEGFFEKFLREWEMGREGGWR